MDETERQRALKVGIVGRHVPLYQSSTWFRQMVDTEARLLTEQVEAWVVMAEKKQVEHDDAVRLQAAADEIDRYRAQLAPSRIRSV
jgi:hypothetical protein